MGLQLDFRYAIGSMLGICRLVQFTLGILVLICVGSASIQNTGVSFIYFVAVASLITSLIFLVLHVIHFPETGPFARLPWNLLECCFLMLWTLLYVISGIMTAVWSIQWKGWTGNMNVAYGAASFFCFAAAAVYGFCAFTYFRRWRFQGSTSGVTVEQRTTTTTTSARY